MERLKFYVDFNEMLETDLVLLSAEDAKRDSQGKKVDLQEGMQIIVYSDETDADNNPDNLIASGVVEKNKTTGWAAHVKWCCRIDEAGIVHESDWPTDG